MISSRGSGRRRDVRSADKGRIAFILLRRTLSLAPSLLSFFILFLLPVLRQGPSVVYMETTQPHQVYLNSDQIYTCSGCHAHLARNEDIISKVKG